MEKNDRNISPIQKAFREAGRKINNRDSQPKEVSITFKPQTDSGFRDISWNTPESSD